MLVLVSYFPLLSGFLVAASVCKKIPIELIQVESLHMLLVKYGSLFNNPLAICHFYTSVMQKAKTKNALYSYFFVAMNNFYREREHLCYNHLLTGRMKSFFISETNQK